ncbi:HlyU family transcriptional regulator [Gymnodinialimonas sp. 2305UL16-5]|uniref:HlyU family transcriptional regulator n=1 Tax=Gymnodinialimonas mytili TaxID=3126503 RepID=UPI0030A19197
MSIFSKLFGGGAKPEAQAEEYDGFRIFAEPMADGGGHRVCARIEKDVDGEIKTHTMIRADVCQSADEARNTSILKAKLLIDQQGSAIFN